MIKSQIQYKKSVHERGKRNKGNSNNYGIAECGVVATLTAAILVLERCCEACSLDLAPREQAHSKEKAMRLLSHLMALE